MNPLFSVIIPLYNKENFVHKSITSVLHQTIQDFEIIVVNDGSTDASLSVVTGFTSSKIKILEHTTNKGLSASRNTGIKHALANYLVFLDADDTWKPDFLEEIQTLILQFPQAKLFATNYEEVYPNTLVLLPKNNLLPLQNRTLIPDFFAYSYGQPLYCACSICVVKSVFETVGYYDETITYSEDVDFNIRANLKFALAYSNKALVSYFMFSENQITQSAFSTKTIPNFDLYEAEAAHNKSLKKYLDFNRYISAKRYKMEHNIEKYKQLTQKIDTKNLNWKQRLLLQLPSIVLQTITFCKQFLIRKGIRWTTYSNRL